MSHRATTAENLFGRALDIPPGPARAEFLAKGCANDTHLRREVESLLSAHAEAGSFLNEEPFDLSSAPHLSGFRIEAKLGEGALGIVFAAHDEKLNRRVAIKVLRSVPDAE